VINREKCVFGIEEVEFLGHHVNARGVATIASCVAAILEHPQPTTVKELQGFLGVINFYRRFVPAAATQVKYSAFDRELLACVSGFRHFRHMLEGRQFTIYTDHKSLTYTLSRTSDPWSARQVRQLSYLAEHSADIRNIAGEENVIADTLSRPPPSAAAYVKEPSGSLAAAWQGGKPESSSPSMGQPTVCAVSAIAQKLDFAAIAEHQKTCQATLQASKSSPSTPRLLR
jgi:hypothetical protein